MKVKPNPFIGVFEDKVAIIPLFDPDKTESGLLYVPDQAKERSDQGIVKYVGSQVKNVRPGDYVVFSGYSGKNVFIQGEGLLLIMREEDIACTINGEDVDNLEVPGLYFKGKLGYFQATYSMAMKFIAEALQESDWHGFLKTKPAVLGAPSNSTSSNLGRKRKSPKHYFKRS